MSPERLRDVARNLFESSKVGDNRTLGEKAIGILAFQQLAGRCDVVSRVEGSTETWAFALREARPLPSSSVRGVGLGRCPVPRSTSRTSTPTPFGCSRSARLSTTSVPAGARPCPR